MKYRLGFLSLLLAFRSRLVVVPNEEQTKNLSILLLTAIKVMTAKALANTDGSICL